MSETGGRELRLADQPPSSFKAEGWAGQRRHVCKANALGLMLSSKRMKEKV